MGVTLMTAARAMVICSIAGALVGCNSGTSTPHAARTASTSSDVNADHNSDSGGGLSAPPTKATQPTSSRLPVASDELRRVARLFLGFARGRLDGVPADNPIDLYVGGSLAKTIKSDEQGNPTQWQTCPEGGSYAGQSCPISVLAPLREWTGHIAFTSARPRHPCAHPSTLPASLNAYHSVTLTPEATTDCTRYFAVQLLVNDVGQIAAVNLVMAEP